MNEETPLTTLADRFGYRHVGNRKCNAKNPEPECNGRGHTIMFKVDARWVCLRCARFAFADEPVGATLPKYDEMMATNQAAFEKGAATDALKALGVISKDPEIRKYLIGNDPNALGQVENAMAGLETHFSIKVGA